MTLPTGSAASPRTPAARPRRYCLHASRLRAWVIGAVVLGPRWTTPFTAGKPRDCGSGRGPAAGRGERQLDCAHSRLRDPARSPAAEPAGRSKVEEKCMRSACEVLDLTPLSGLGASPRSHDHISPARRAYRRVSRCIDGKLNGEMPSQMSKNAACQVQPACRTQSPCTAQPRRGAGPGHQAWASPWWMCSLGSAAHSFGAPFSRQPRAISPVTSASISMMSILAMLAWASSHAGTMPRPRPAISTRIRRDCRLRSPGTGARPRSRRAGRT